MNGVKIEAGRHLEDHCGNLRDNNRLNQAEPCFLSRKPGEKCLDSVCVFCFVLFCFFNLFFIYLFF